jgi:hypothetical protein
MLLVSACFRKVRSLISNVCRGCGGFVLLAGLLLFPGTARADGGIKGNDGGDGIWWHFAKQERTQDHGVAASFVLYGADDLKIDKLEFFYTTEFSYRDVQSENQRVVYHKTVPADTRSLVLYSSRYERFELWAVAKLAGGKTVVAQTAINLYGASGIDRNNFEKLDNPPIPPGFDVNWTGGVYTAMSGEPVDFSIRNGYAGPVRVLIDGKNIEELRPDAGVYSCVPPWNRKLIGVSFRAYRDLLFIADDEDILFTCCLPLYRGRQNDSDLPGGLTVLLATVTLGLGAVILKGRRFAWR